MAYFVQVGGRILNLESIAFAQRTDAGLKVVFGSKAGEVLMELFEGADADRAEGLLLKYQEIIETSLRRQRVIEAQL
jgi:hypothetical protein